MEAYPSKLRELTLEAYERGEATAEIAERLKVSRSWARRVWQRWRERKIRTAFEPARGAHPKLGEAERARLAELVEKTPDATLAELNKELGEPVCINTIWRTLNQMRQTLKKKSLNSSERDRPDVKEQREVWQECLPGLDLDRLVFIDESGVNVAMTRTRGRCPRGQRLVDSVPGAHWKNYTLVAALRLEETFAPLLLDGSMNAETFVGYVETCLAPGLRPRDIVIIDNVKAHKDLRVEEAIKAVGCTLVYLPPYSPDFNPIENMWSKVKSHMRKAAARTLDTIVDAFKGALDAVTPEECENYFDHCGYSLQ